VQDGYFAGAPNAITQTSDGYLWIGTQGGLVRFDGVRFVPWTPPAGKQLQAATVISLLGARDGSLWIGTAAGLSHWIGGDLVSYPVKGRINAIVEDRNGTVWFIRSRVPPSESGPLCQVSQADARCYGTADGIPFPYATALAEDPAGGFWVGSSTKLTRWAQGSATTYDLPALTAAEGLGGISSLAPTADGGVWVALSRSGRGMGLQQLKQGSWTPFTTPGLDGSSLEIFSLFVDRNRSQWIGTVKNGVYRIRDGLVEQFRSADGLSSDSINSMYQDREGNLWVATAKGIDNFRDIPVVTFSSREGLSADFVGSVFAAHDGTVWLGNLNALDSVRLGQASHTTTRKGFPGRQLTALLEDRAGALWIAVDNRLLVQKNGSTTDVKRPDGTPVGVVIALAEAGDNIWAATIGNPARLVRIQGQQVREELSAPQVPPVAALAADGVDGVWLGLLNGDLARYRGGRLESFHFEPPAGPVREVRVSPDGSVLGATAGGLLGWRNGKQQTLTVQNGLPCNTIHTLIFDGAGGLWLYAACGLVALAPEELQRWWEDPTHRVTAKVYDALDGALPSGSPYHPASSRSPDGRLWFVNDNTLQMVDPARMLKNAIAPPVQIETIVADRKNYSPTDALRLPPLTRDLQIDYTALSFVAPQKVRFRYRLEGYDKDWVDPGSRRQAFYSDLRPGTYRFQVIACNNDGVWNEEGAVVVFTILPRFYQTRWFLLLCIGVAGGLAWLAYRWRVHQVRARLQAQFDERLAVRTRIAQDLHDTLLQGIVGASMQLDVAVDQLPAGSPERDRFARIHELIRHLIQQGRNTVEGLRSAGFTVTESADTLEQEFANLRQELDTYGHTSFAVKIQGAVRPLNPDLREEVSLIGHEALVNAFRHSGAAAIEVELDYATTGFRMLIRDDGKGIDPAIAQSGRPGHWGLAGMRERAAKIGATLTIAGGPKPGTDVELSVPGHLAFADRTPNRLRAWFRKSFWRSLKATSPNEGK
jgi:signal transduction histidine kinase/ligand-binding sensor domain-containing protein